MAIWDKVRDIPIPRISSCYALYLTCLCGFNLCGPTNLLVFVTFALVALCNLAPIRLTVKDILHYKADTNRCNCHIPSRHTGFMPIQEGRYRYCKCRKHRKVYREEIQMAAGLIPIPPTLRGFKHNPREVEVDPPFMEHEIAHRIITIPIP